MEFNGLLWKVTRCYGKTFVAKEVTGYYGKSVAIESYWLLMRYMATMESQWNLYESLICYGKSLVGMKSHWLL
jgi:hypothetical protein